MARDPQGTDKVSPVPCLISLISLGSWAYGLHQTKAPILILGVLLEVRLGQVPYYRLSHVLLVLA